MVATYSIAACDLERREWGVAVQSKFLAVGAAVPAAEAEVGAVATQAWANLAYRADGLALLRDGLPAEAVVGRLVEADDGRDQRQVGVVDRSGGAASYTGRACLEWAGGRTGPGFAAQGNILVSGATVDALAETFTAGGGEPLAPRLLACLAAAQAAGGDRRGQQSAALVVVRREGGYGGTSDVAVDLRVDDHPRPVAELERLYGLHDLLFGQTPEEEWLPVDAALAGELRERLAALGYAHDDLRAALEAWAGTENFEERVRGAERVDPVVLEQLRLRSDR
ncbi:MAG TPA: DUF1028 domain-containing protein [Gaiellaceae bacterium]|nr:DUF1028 domain-containing protein [Gaiellaceae bacterium]